MKEVLLSQGKVSLIDDQDFDYLNQTKWFAHRDRHGRTFYAVGHIRIDGIRKLVKMHHVLIGYPEYGFVTDHIDGDGLNNQRCNLRFVTHRQSCLNRKHTSRLSKYPGVTWLKRQKKWQAQARLEGSHKYLGVFNSEYDAHLAYAKATGCWYE